MKTVAGMLVFIVLLSLAVTGCGKRPQHPQSNDDVRADRWRPRITADKGSVGEAGQNRPDSSTQKNDRQQAKSSVGRVSQARESSTGVDRFLGVWSRMDGDPNTLTITKKSGRFLVREGSGMKGVASLVNDRLVVNGQLGLWLLWIDDNGRLNADFTYGNEFGKGVVIYDEKT